MAQRIVVPILWIKGSIRNTSCYGAMNLLEHGMKVLKGVLEKRICKILSVNDMLFGFIPERSPIDVVLFLDVRSASYKRKKVVCLLWI